MKKMFLECGKIVTTHGLHGEFKVQPWCDSPEFLQDFSRFFLDSGGKAVLKAESVRIHKGMAVIKAEGIDDIDAAASLRGRIIYISRIDAALEDGEYFVADIIDCEAVDADTGRIYGKISYVSQTGANDVYHIMSPGGRELLVPAIPSVIIEKDIDNGRIFIRPMRGLFDDED